MNNPMYYLMAWLAPDRCLVCQVEGALLCESCRAHLPAIGPGCFFCGKLVALADSPNASCAICLQRHGLDVAVARTFYRHDTAKQLLRLLKLRHSSAAAVVMASELVAALPWPGKNTIIVPIPTANQRIRRRGFDQAVLIAKAAAKQAKLPCCCALVRLGKSEQKQLGRKDRLAMAARAFRVRQNNSVKGKDVILIDDVITTGATLEAAARLLKSHGAKKIAAMVFAAA